MTKKMLVKTESVAMTGRGGSGGGVQGSDERGWYNETNVNVSPSIFSFFLRNSL